MNNIIEMIKKFIEKILTSKNSENIEERIEKIVEERIKNIEKIVEERIEKIEKIEKIVEERIENMEKMLDKNGSSLCYEMQCMEDYLIKIKAASFIENNGFTCEYGSCGRVLSKTINDICIYYFAVFLENTLYYVPVYDAFDKSYTSYVFDFMDHPFIIPLECDIKILEIDEELVKNNEFHELYFAEERDYSCFIFKIKVPAVYKTDDKAIAEMLDNFSSKNESWMTAHEHDWIEYRKMLEDEFSESLETDDDEIEEIPA